MLPLTHSRFHPVPGDIEVVGGNETQKMAVFQGAVPGSSDVCVCQQVGTAPISTHVTENLWKTELLWK